jgi:hypothetical protein
LGLLNDLISWLIVGVLLARVISIYVSYRPSRVRWGLAFSWLDPAGKQNTPVVVLASVAGAERQEYKNLHTDIGQVRSVSALTPSLDVAYRTGNKSVLAIFSEDPTVWAACDGKDIVTLGGGKNNRVSARFIADLESRLGDDFSVNMIASEVNVGEMVDVPRWDGVNYFSSNKQVFGFIARIKNPLDASNYVTLIAGAGTYGTEAAALALVNNRELLKWLRRHRSKREFVALVEGALEYASGSAGMVQGVKLLDIREVSGSGVSTLKYSQKF